MSNKPPHRLLADECVYKATVEFLRGLSYHVVTVQELGLGEAKDITIIQQAVALERTLLTRDMDFSSILLYPPAQYLGIVVLKMTPQTTHVVHSVLSQALSDVKDLRPCLAYRGQEQIPPSALRLLGWPCRAILAREG